MFSFQQIISSVKSAAVSGAKTLVAQQKAQQIGPYVPLPKKTPVQITSKPLPQELSSAIGGQPAPVSPFKNPLPTQLSDSIMLKPTTPVQNSAAQQVAAQNKPLYSNTQISAPVNGAVNLFGKVLNPVLSGIVNKVTGGQVQGFKPIPTETPESEQQMNEMGQPMTATGELYPGASKEQAFQPYIQQKQVAAFTHTENQKVFQNLQQQTNDFVDKLQKTVGSSPVMPSAFKAAAPYVISQLSDFANGIISTVSTGEQGNYEYRDTTQKTQGYGKSLGAALQGIQLPLMTEFNLAHPVQATILKPIFNALPAISNSLSSALSSALAGEDKQKYADVNSIVNPILQTVLPLALMHTSTTIGEGIKTSEGFAKLTNDFHETIQNIKSDPAGFVKDLTKHPFDVSALKAPEETPPAPPRMELRTATPLPAVTAPVGESMAGRTSLESPSVKDFTKYSQMAEDRLIFKNADDMKLIRSKDSGEVVGVQNRAGDKMMLNAPTAATPETPAKPNILARAGQAVSESPVGQMYDELKSGIFPGSKTEEAKGTSLSLRNAHAEIANQEAVEAQNNTKNLKFFRAQGDEANIKNISKYEKTGQFENAPEGYSEFYKKSTDTANEVLKKVYGKDRVGYVENYVRRAFKFGSKADEVRGTNYLTNKIGSLSASKSPIKGRVLDMPLDEAMQEMKDRGISVKMANANPEVLRQWTVNNARQAATYADFWQGMKDSGNIEFIKTGSRIPEGKIALNDRATKVFFPTDKGLVAAGQYYADPSVARIVNNAIDPGFSNSPTYQFLRKINNSINQFNLGLSAFHLTGTAFNAGASDMALGFENLFSGKVAEGATQVGRSILPGMSFIRDTYNGGKFVKEVTAGNPEARQILTEKFNPAGGRLATDQAYLNDGWNKMMDSFSNKKIVKGAIQFPRAILEKVASPLMQYAIPRVKIGAWMDMVKSFDTKSPNAAPEEKQAAYAKAWDSIDNRFGQMVYDNLNWNKGARDLTQIGIRSIGWNWGTIRELGGGLGDVLTGKAPASSRFWYSMALPIYAGMLGGAYQYMHTGQWPTEIKDYFYPKNGNTDKHGNPERVSLPTYMKDVFSYATDPLATVTHKESPLIGLAVELGTNKDYYGNMVRNPNDPASTQLLQAGTAVLNQVMPFTVQQVQQQFQEKASLPTMAESFAGFNKAPMAMDKTETEKELEKTLQQTRPGAPSLTPEQAAAQIQNQKDAEDEFQKLKTMAATDKTAANAEYEKLKQGDPSLAKKVKTIADDDKLGITATDRLVKMLNVQDGSRADFIWGQVNKLTDKDAKNQYIADLQKKNILTADVMKQLRVIKESGGKPYGDIVQAKKEALGVP